MSEDPILGELLSDTRGVIRRLLAEPLDDPSVLRAELERGGARYRSLDQEQVLADLPLARAIERRCTEWLDGWAGLDPRSRKLAQVGLRYFVLEDDGDGDLTSPFGFDDDLEVVNAVSRALGQRAPRSRMTPPTPIRPPPGGAPVPGPARQRGLRAAPPAPVTETQVKKEGHQRDIGLWEGWLRGAGLR